MTLEEKQLLFKDLCARLHYGVKIKTSKGDGVLCSIDYIPDGAYLGVSINGAVKEYFEYQDAEPYLRPMSSMTKEEEKEFLGINENVKSYGRGYYAILSIDIQDWLNAHHFDYRGLIEKGLAIEAPKNMYKND